MGAIPGEVPGPDGRAGIPPPERPAEMARTDEAGAVAAAQYFLSLFGYGAATGDVAEWDAMSDPDCLGCAGLREEMVATHRAGSHDPREDPVVNAVWVADPIDGAHVVLLGVDYELSDIPASSDPAEAVEMPVAVVIVGIIHTGDGWLVQEFLPGGPEYLPDVPGSPP
ncbi:DUF6318 family protein [Georgenia sp. MJ278]